LCRRFAEITLPIMSGSPSALEYSLALFVRHWAANMTLAYKIGEDWPGFAYTDGEKEEMRALDQTVPRAEFLTWIALAAVFSILTIAVVVSLLLFAAFAVLGGPQHAGFPFFFYFAMIFGLCSVLRALVIASATVGRFRGVGMSLLPEKATVTRLFQKVRFQFVRNALVGVTLIFLVMILLDRLGI
jgi:hypothetical protein